ncbi:MAG: hypothetical protein GY820_37620 [Gammaproteobacteria bacterium]|nr:hypothetical protein [Gammaproteobacteria bacterium]
MQLKVEELTGTKPSVKYEGYMDISKDVALGYTVLLSESVEQLACGEISSLAGDYDIEAGESAVAGLATLITACNDQDMTAKLGLGQSSRVYVIATEGATDAEVYERLINNQITHPTTHSAQCRRV